MREIAGVNRFIPGQDVRPSETEALTQQVPAQNGSIESAAPDAGQVPAAAWLPSERVNDPLAKSVTLLSFKDGDAPVSGGTNASSTKASVTKSADTKRKIDAYFDRSNTEYTMQDGSKVRAQPHFRMNTVDRESGDSGRRFEDQLNRTLKPRDPAFKRAIHMVAYGRATPEQIKQVTQALIDKGGVAAVKKVWQEKGEEEFNATFPNTSWPLNDADAVKLLQWSMGVGVDCAGYAQQEFVAVHGGSPGDYGLQSIGDENLASLKGNRHFKQVGPAAAGAGDLMILDPADGIGVGHAVMVQDRHAMTDAERAGYRGIGGFAKPGDKVQVFVVEGSFGAGGHGDPERGGVQRRTFFYNETTGKWADMRRDWDKASAPSVHISSTDGPYEHPLNGIFHPKGK